MGLSHEVRRFHVHPSPTHFFNRLSARLRHDLGPRPRVRIKRHPKPFFSENPADDVPVRAKDDSISYCEPHALEAGEGSIVIQWRYHWVGIMQSVSRDGDWT
jgi:hypothetical protein